MATTMAVQRSTSSCSSHGRNDHLLAKARDLENHFAEYKRRIGAQRDATPEGERTAEEVAAVTATYGFVCGRGGGGEDRRGEMYEKYATRRDARLRDAWRLRMEEKHFQMSAMWTRLERTHAEMMSRFGVGDVDARSGKESPARKMTQRSTAHLGEKISSSITPSTALHKITVAGTKKKQSSKMLQRGQELSGCLPSQSDVKKNNKKTAVSKHNYGKLYRNNNAIREISIVKELKPHNLDTSMATTGRDRGDLRTDGEDVIVEIQKSNIPSGTFLRKGMGARFPATKENASKISGNRKNKEPVQLMDKLERFENVDKREGQFDKDDSSDEENTLKTLKSTAENSLGSNSTTDVSQENNTSEMTEESSHESPESWYSNVQSSLSNMSAFHGEGCSPTAIAPQYNFIHQLNEMVVVQESKGRCKGECILVSLTPPSPKGLAKGFKRLLSNRKKCQCTKNPTKCLTISLGENKNGQKLLKDAPNDLNNPEVGYPASESDTLDSSHKTPFQAHKFFFHFPYFPCKGEDARQR